MFFHCQILAKILVHYVIQFGNFGLHILGMLYQFLSVRRIILLFWKHSIDELFGNVFVVNQLSVKYQQQMVTRKLRLHKRKFLCDKSILKEKATTR